MEPLLTLVPTALERERLPSEEGLGRVELCGFGPVAAAARTAQLVHELRPERILLLGIAGSFDLDVLPVGSAATFDEVVLEGIGAGDLGPRELDLPQLPGVYDTLPLSGASGRLLTVCSASGDASAADRRRERWSPLAEDMEAFGVALAAGSGLTVVRGISNPVGVREGWEIQAALAAAYQHALEVLA